MKGPAARFPALPGGHLLVLVLAVAGYLLVANAYVEHGSPNNDEGFYAEASREAMRGRIPYRDFGYTQTPLLPYIQGTVMRAVGFGIRAQRGINVAWTTLAVVLAVMVWRRAGLGPLACAELLLAWFLCQALIYYDTIGKTYALTQLLLLAAASTLYLRIPPHAKLWLLSLSCVLAFGCRLTVAPSLVVLWLALALGERGRISRAALVGVPALVALLLLGPFIAADPSNAAFWTLRVHLASVLPRIRLEVLVQSLLSAPAFAVAGIAAFLVLRSRGNGAAGYAPWITAAGAAGWVIAVALPGTYSDYATPFLPLLMLGCGCSLAAAAPRVRLVACGCIVAASAGGLLLEHEKFLAGDYPAAVERVADYVRMNTRPGDPVLTPMPEVAIESGRAVFPLLEMGKFGLTGDMDPRAANARHMLSRDQLVRVVELQRAPIIVLSRSRDANFAWSFPSMLSFTPEAYHDFAWKLLSQYDCTYADTYFLVFEKSGTKTRIFHVEPADLGTE
jgi:hypothetical protein